MAEYIDFPAKLRSSRRDRKLVDAEAIDGEIQRSQLAEDARGSEKPLIENAFDGTTGTDTGEVEVDGVTIENLGNVAYLIRVGAATEYVLGDALYAQRSAAALEIGIANFYSKGAADAGKLFHTLDEGTDDALEIWKVNDLAAIRSVISAAGKTDAQIGDAAFSNPPADLTDDEKTAAREAIDAGPDHPSNETFTIPEVGTNGVSEHDPLILAARGNVLIGHYFGDSDHFGRSEDLNLGIEGIATEDAASGSVKMLAWGLVTGLPMGPKYTHSELQTATNAPPGKPVYVTDRSSRVRPGGSTDNRNTSADLTYWTLDPDESADGEIYGYCVEWEGAAGTNQQGVYGVIFDFRRVPFPSSS